MSAEVVFVISGGSEQLLQGWSTLQTMCSELLVPAQVFMRPVDARTHRYQVQVLEGSLPVDDFVQVTERALARQVIVESVQVTSIG